MNKLLMNFIFLFFASTHMVSMKLNNEVIKLNVWHKDFNIDNIRGVGFIRINNDFREHMKKKYLLNTYRGSFIAKELEAYLMFLFEIEQHSQQHDDLIGMINSNVSSEKDLLNYAAIVCVLHSYKYKFI